MVGRGELHKLADEGSLREVLDCPPREQSPFAVTDDGRSFSRCAVKNLERSSDVLGRELYVSSTVVWRVHRAWDHSQSRYELEPVRRPSVRGLLTDAVHKKDGASAWLELRCAMHGGVQPFDLDAVGARWH